MRPAIPRLRDALAGGARSFGRLPRPARWSLVALAVAVLAVIAISYALDEPLRRYVERRMNASLDGYRVAIARLDFHPIGLSITLDDLVFVQEARPDPPILHIPRLDASVQWRSIALGRLVANFTLTRPVLYADITHLRREAADPKKVTERGWQEAFQAIYPLKINQFKIVNGHVTYYGGGPFAPLQVSFINLAADNIRNIRSRAHDYPSAVHFDARLFDTGAIAADGHADFLAVPHPGVKAEVAIEHVDLDYFKALTHAYGVSIKDGRLSATGLIEYAPTVKVVDLREATVEGVTVEYSHTPARAGVVQATTAKAATAAQQVTNEPGVLLRARSVRVTGSTVAFVNRAVNPGYRAFVSGLTLTLENFSNHLPDGRMLARMTGRFMGTGATSATATFRPARTGPDFDLSVRIENTDMRGMNDMLRSYGKFDVSAGSFSLFSEIAVKNRHIDGYVKPLFSGLDVYSPEQDRHKSL
ncbi:MAG TPA: DUF748 domain-containing protein, partial [Vicinamibacteria bacterium]|nr:DUF748 domain-containing protein [Vicinamibacteria bacterium]